jgi:hypothetical protein
MKSSIEGTSPTLIREHRFCSPLLSSLVGLFLPSLVHHPSALSVANRDGLAPFVATSKQNDDSVAVFAKIDAIT